MVRVEAFNLPYNFRLAGAIDFTDIVMPRLALNWNGIYLLKMAAHDFTGRMGGANRNVYD
jgi:hypothetical protein